MTPDNGTPGHASRKDEHLNLAVRLYDRGRQNASDGISFIHHALPGTSVDSTDPDTTVFGVRWETPFYINTMTGGTRATAETDTGLAGAAADAGVAIARDSQHIALRDPGCADGFRTIRSEAPQASMLANVGPTATPEDVARAVEMPEANAL